MADQSDQEQREREWCEQLDSLGVDVIKARLATFDAGPHGLFATIKASDGKEPLRVFVEKWRSEKESEQRGIERSRFRWIIVIGLAGIVTTIVIGALTLTGD